MFVNILHLLVHSVRDTVRRYLLMNKCKKMDAQTKG